MITIAPPTDAQREAIAKHWVRVLVPRRGPMMEPTIDCGRAKVSRFALLSMARAWIAECMETASIAAGSMRVDGQLEMVGFVVWSYLDNDERRLHMIHVLGDARRMGVGTKLLEHALEGAAGVNSSCSTPTGDALLGLYLAEGWTHATGQHDALSSEAFVRVPCTA